MIRKSYPWSASEIMFHDVLLEKWREQMRNEFNAFSRDGSHNRDASCLQPNARDDQRGFFVRS